jgi:GAF domain-containing protein
MEAPFPPNEAERLRSLALYEILDTLPEAIFDEITLLATYICGCPIATVSIIDKNRQWYKSRIGINAAETPREISFCAHTIRQNEPLIVEDATLDERFRDNPVVLHEPHVRFYAGVALVNQEGYALGTLCVVDQQPRQLSDEQIVALDALSRHVMTHLELRRAQLEHQKAKDVIRQLTEQLRQAAERADQLHSAYESLQAEKKEPL